MLKNSIVLLSILSCVYAYGDVDDGSDESTESPTPLTRPGRPTIEAMNYPARFDTSPCNISTSVSFNYMQAYQENMEFGIRSRGEKTDVTTSGLTIISVKSSNILKFLNMDFAFKPGFTVAVDANFCHDKWDTRLEYTWFHSSNVQKASEPNFILFHTDTPSIAPTWGILLSPSVIEYFQFASEKWKLSMDILDWDVGRWFNVGSRLTVRPSIGARAAWIDQRVRVAYTNGFTTFPIDLPLLVGSATLVEDKTVHGRSDSWGVGLEAAIETRWNLGGGWRIFGNGEADLLFTRYTKLFEKTITNGTVVGIIDLIPFVFGLGDKTKGRQYQVNCVRPHFDLELGFGWGNYIRNTNLYIDFSASYEFQVFFDQNMFRHDVTNVADFLPNGNLYMQGLIGSMNIGF